MKVSKLIYCFDVLDRKIELTKKGWDEVIAQEQAMIEISDYYNALGIELVDIEYQ